MTLHIDGYMVVNRLVIWQCRFEGNQICAHWIFGQFAFVSNAVKTYCTENGHGILCTDDIIIVKNEAINIDNTNQNYQI